MARDLRLGPAMNLPRWLAVPVDVTWRSLRLFASANGLSWAGALGLYLFLSVPPLMVASAYVGTWIATESESKAFVIQQASRFVPARAELLQSVLVREAPLAGGAALVSLLFLLFSGSRTFAALASGINRMWRRTDQLSLLKTQALRAGMLVLAFVLLAAVGGTEAAITNLLGGSGSAPDERLWLIESQILPFLVLGVFLFIAYRVLPETHVEWEHALIGAVLATIGVRISQAVMGLMAEAGTFDTPYGQLAGVGLMATWALVVGVAVLLGASFVAVLGGVEPDD